MARTRSTLTMTTAALALLALSASVSAQQPGHDQPPPQGGDHPAQSGRPNDMPPRDSGRPNPSGDRPQVHPEASQPRRSAPQRDTQRADAPRDQGPHEQGDRNPGARDSGPRDSGPRVSGPHDSGRDPRPDGDHPVPKESRPDTPPDQPRQQEAERRREQEQHWQQQRGQQQRPIREDVREITHRDPHGRSFDVPTNDRVNVVTDPGRFDWAAQAPRHSFNGCPPGIAKRYANCAPPAISEAAPNRWKLPGWYGDFTRDAGYRYTDGYLLRLGADSAVSSYIPLLGGALAVGQPWSATYGAAPLPDYYSRYYDLGPASGYRYYDDVIYRVDPDDAAITAVAALLTGNAIEVGQPMPSGYDVYNVPYRYRDQYFDGPKALYRYSDGTIYQIDPATRLVQAAIELLA
ncbi:hypothetical protein WBP06_12410 [Novosphingobium sp. BL-8H]|uniref:hypothetical protein n=1 Tax=Novosphingobium sp. BL-8H TaxID=3127640 RepID=UPI003756B092